MALCRQGSQPQPDACPRCAAATPAADKVLDELQSGWHANPIIYQHDTSPVHKARIAAWLKDRAAKHSA